MPGLDAQTRRARRLQAGTLAVGELLTAFLVGTNPRDPTTLVAVFSVLALIGLLACVVPALRATRLDPLAALRRE
jgi:putative ABC transport system permease protein